jgi:hypothetical protein
MGSQEKDNHPWFGTYPCAINLEKIARETGHHKKVSRMVHRYNTGFDKLFRMIYIQIANSEKRSAKENSLLASEEFGFRWLVIGLYRDYCIKQAEISTLTDNEKSHLINVIKTRYKILYRHEKDMLKFAAEQRRLERRKEKKEKL